PTRRSSDLAGDLEQPIDLLQLVAADVGDQEAGRVRPQIHRADTHHRRSLGFGPTTNESVVATRSGGAATMKLEGIHHVTAITGDAPGNVDFYTRVLGLRLVKKSVNQDDPTVYHLFYADEAGSAG